MCPHCILYLIHVWPVVLWERIHLPCSRSIVSSILKQFFAKVLHNSPYIGVLFDEISPFLSNQPANVSRIRKWCLPCLYPWTFQTPTSCNLTQIWLLTPLPNGFSHVCLTKFSKTSLSDQKSNLLTIFEWIYLVWKLVNSERYLFVCIGT